MRSASASDMSKLIGSCPVHTAVVKAVGYGWVSCEQVVAKLTDATAAHGRPAVEGVARALLDYEHEGNTVYCRLKPVLHVYCRTLLGPMPSEWDHWWQNADGSDRKGKPEDWPPKLLTPAEQEQAAKAAEASAAKTAPLVAAGLSADSVTEVEQLTTTHGRQLRLILKAAHDMFRVSRPGDPMHAEAIRRMDLIEAEMRRRGNKVPPRPAWTDPYDPDIDRFRQATTVRLRELLDGVRHELTEHLPDSVTYEEALRDVGLIEAELNRRGERGDEPAA